MNAKFKHDWENIELDGADCSWRAQAEKMIQMFVRRVNAQAEQNMLKTGKLEGAHHAAMDQQLKEWGIEV